MESVPLTIQGGAPDTQGNLRIRADTCKIQRAKCTPLLRSPMWRPLRLWRAGSGAPAGPRASGPAPAREDRPVVAVVIRVTVAPETNLAEQVEPRLIPEGLLATVMLAPLVTRKHNSCAFEGDKC